MDQMTYLHPDAPNAQDLAYFIAMQEARLANTPDHSAAKWNQRAESWKRERNHQRKGDDRVISAVSYLEQRGILHPGCDVVDIGCGPGRFAAAFAQKAHRVVGLDLSEKMVEHGMEHIREKGLTNATLYTCDFQTLDIDKEGYQGAFDLVFASMTPAIHGMKGLQKSMEMSRGWCCNITHLGGSNSLRSQILRDVFGKTPAAQWTGRWFYSLFNVLFLMGYQPETSYDTHSRETWIPADEEYARSVMDHLLPMEAQNEENAAKILAWLQAHQNEEGLVQEVTEVTYGRILWDVRNRVDRPDYRSMDGGI